MKNLSIVRQAFGTSIALVIVPLLAHAEQWPGFRGNGKSVSRASNLPLQWSDASISWRAQLPGTGQSSPVRWDRLIFATSADRPNKETLWVTCHDLETGKERWRQSVKNSAPEEITGYVSCAAPTPVVDSKHVYALFESGDLAAFTHAGDFIWTRKLAGQFGPFQGNHGQGASPALSSHGLVVLMDHDGTSYLASLDKQNGKTQWQTKRVSKSSWASPVVRIPPDHLEEIVCSASGSVASYEAQTGQPRWEHTAINGNNVPSATISQNYLVAGSSRKNNTQVLRIDQDEPILVWKSKEATSSFGSPLIHQGRVYIVNKAGILYCYQLETGKLLFDYRIASSTWASPLGYKDFIMCFGVDGSASVFRASDTAELVHESKISIPPKDRVYGYALSNDRIILRTGTELLCIGN